MSNPYWQHHQESLAASDPVELVCAVYDHAIRAVGEARQSHGASDRLGRGAAIAKASELISELIASLDHERGGALSQSLGELYGYMLTRLTEAHCGDSEEPLTEVQTLLGTVAGGWRGVAAGRRVAIAEPAIPIASSCETLSAMPISYAGYAGSAVSAYA
jgi:flagellar protein FliS